MHKSNLIVVITEANCVSLICFFSGRLACVNGKIYAVGGSGDMVSLPSLQTVDVYDRATDAWSQAASMSERRTGMGELLSSG